MADILTKMQEFNKLIDRISKGSKYLDSGKASESDVKLFAGLLEREKEIEAELKELGYTVTTSDYLYGIWKGGERV